MDYIETDRKALRGAGETLMPAEHFLFFEAVQVNKACCPKTAFGKALEGLACLTQTVFL